MKLKTFCAGLCLTLPTAEVRADAVWQWSAPVGNGRAFLWVPENCRQVRAVIIGQNNMIEQGILERDFFRTDMAKLGIAEIFIAPPFDTFQSATNNERTKAQDRHAG
jgi:hypothetical protein